MQHTSVGRTSYFIDKSEVKNRKLFRKRRWYRMHEQSTPEVCFHGWPAKVCVTIKARWACEKCGLPCVRCVAASTTRTLSKAPISNDLDEDCSQDGYAGFQDVSPIHTEVDVVLYVSMKVPVQIVSWRSVASTGCSAFQREDWLHANNVSKDPGYQLFNYSLPPKEVQRAEPFSVRQRAGERASTQASRKSFSSGQYGRNVSKSWLKQS